MCARYTRLPVTISIQTTPPDSRPFLVRIHHQHLPMPEFECSKSQLKRWDETRAEDRPRCEANCIVSETNIVETNNQNRIIAIALEFLHRRMPCAGIAAPGCIPMLFGMLYGCGSNPVDMPFIIRGPRPWACETGQSLCASKRVLRLTISSRS